MPPSYDACEIAARAALLLGARAGAVIEDRQILGWSGLDDVELSQLQDWLDHDPDTATAWRGELRRVARASWPWSEAEVWVLGEQVRRLPGTAYSVLQAFLYEVTEAA
ncbi:MAG: hypothetical protein ACI9MC_002966 [Kiritimatiellia bacterium]|jgi:hypothetical protein